MRNKTHLCQCADSGCPVHKGSSVCGKRERTVTLYRVDMEDRTGTRFCHACAEDAMNCGIFSEHKPLHYSKSWSDWAANHEFDIQAD